MDKLLWQHIFRARPVDNKKGAEQTWDIESDGDNQVGTRR